jgi:hypothetical protein
VSEDPSETNTVQFTVTTDGEKDLRRELFQAAVDNQWPLLELTRKSASLEEVFRRLTQSDSVASETPAASEKAA